MNTKGWGIALALALAGWAAPRAAEACGGCVHVPSVAPLSVTEHRMALALSARQTTLWDQFSFAGNASDFAWILPIRHDPAVRVELADDRFLAVFDRETTPRLDLPPPPPSPCPTSCAYDPCALPTVADASAASDASGGGVTVYRMNDLGPYAVSVIGGSDAMALRRWLNENNYAVPSSIEPVLDGYIAQRMDFVAVRLRSSGMASRMTPIRVTVPGYAPTLPLRMVSAGISDKVGLQLIVFADSRVEVVNFSNASIRNEEFVFDYAAQTRPPFAGQELADMIRAKRRLAGGRTWLTEAAVRMPATQVRAIARLGETLWQSSSCAPSDAGIDFNCGGPRATADAEIALTGLGDRVTVTRMSAELAYTVLDRDLQLAASAVDTERPRDYSYGTLRNVPTPPVCAPLDCPTRCNRDAAFDSGMARADGSVALSAGGGLRCTVRAVSGRGGSSAFALLAFGAGLVSAVRGRQRARRR